MKYISEPNSRVEPQGMRRSVSIQPGAQHLLAGSDSLTDSLYFLVSTQE